MEKKYFISFEGIDGSGKDTQIVKLVEAIKSDSNKLFGNKYSTIWLTREPTRITKAGNEISDKLRSNKLSGEEAARLFVEDRIEHSRMIEEMLTHSHVLCSRQDLSTLSYQMTQGVDFETLYQMHRYNESDGTVVPHITLVFDLPVEVAFERMSSRDSQEEFFEKREFQEQLKENQEYCIDQLRQRGRTILRINANQPIDKVTEEMVAKLIEVTHG